MEVCPEVIMVVFSPPIFSCGALVFSPFLFYVCIASPTL